MFYNSTSDHRYMPLFQCETTNFDTKANGPVFAYNVMYTYHLIYNNLFTNNYTHINIQGDSSKHKNYRSKHFVDTK